MQGADMAAPDPGRIDARKSARVQGGTNGSVEFDSAGWLAAFHASPDGARQMSAALLPLPPVQATTAPPTLAGIRQLVLDPAYQLK